MTILVQLVLYGLVQGAIYAILALGFGTVYRSTGIFHIAYGVIYTAGAYGLYTASRMIGLPFLLAVLCGLLAGAALGLLMEAVVYRPLFRRNASAVTYMIVSIGILVFVENLIAMIFGNETKVISQRVEPSYGLGSVILSRMQLIQLLVGIASVGLFALALRTSRFAKAIWAMGDQPVLVEVLGLSLLRLRTAVFGLSSVFAASAGCLIAADVGIEPHVGLSALLMAAVAVMIGGRDRWGAWVGGAIILGMVQNLVLWKLSARWSFAAAFILLVLVMLFKPAGLFTTAKRMEET